MGSRRLHCVDLVSPQTLAGTGTYNIERNATTLIHDVEEKESFGELG